MYALKLRRNLPPVQSRTTLKSRSPRGHIDSGTEHLLDHEAGGAVEEEGKEGGEAEEEEGLEDGPAVLVPDDVADRLERVAEPDERRVGAAARETHTRVGFGPLLCSPGGATRHVNRYRHSGRITAFLCMLFE